MTENNISDRGGLESRYTADAIDVITKMIVKICQFLWPIWAADTTDSELRAGGKPSTWFPPGDLGE